MTFNIVRNIPFGNSAFLDEGCPDYRNEFSYFIDVPNRTARYIPANYGYVGKTGERYMIFRSYRYVSDPDVLGRYTLLQIIDENPVMVDFLDLEHVIVEKHRSEIAPQKSKMNIMS